MANRKKKAIIILVYFVAVLLLSVLLSYIFLNKPFGNNVSDNFSSQDQLVSVDFYSVLNKGDSKIIAEYFADDICEILITEFVTIKPTEYILKDKTKIEEALQILSNAYYGEEVSEFAIKDFVSDMKFEFKDDKEIKTLLEMDFWIESGVIKLTKGENTKYFLFPEKSYVDMRSLPTQRFYLHNSALEVPSEAFCINIKNEVLSGLTADEKIMVGKKVRSLHEQMENILLNNIPYLKEKDSTYWNFVITGLSEEKVTVTGENLNELGLNGCLNKIDVISRSFTNKRAVDDFGKLYNSLKKACEDKDLEAILKVHEVIHDYDYFAVNYPVRYNYEAADWGGLNDYFGNLE